MKVSELRDLLKKYNNDELRILVVEMYKAIPKKMKENKEIDEIVQDVLVYMNKGKVKKQDNQINFDDLKQEIEQFIEYAYKQYYLAPNSFVHKKERPKWRFKVKRFFKELQMVTATGKDAELAVVDLMKRLYEMLCYACGYYIFNTEDPFRSVGMTQDDAFDAVISRKFTIGKNAESIKFAIELMINNGLDRETLYSELMLVLMKQLTIADLKVIMIQQCKLLKENLEKGKPTNAKKSRGYVSSDYERQDKINNLVEMIFRCHIELIEYDEAINYFHANYQEKDKEIVLYILLRLLFQYKLKDQWKKEYERAVNNGVEPRGSLYKVYNYVQDNDTFPKYMY